MRLQGNATQSSKFLCCFMYFLCCSMYFYFVLCILCFVSSSVLLVCISVLYYCHRVATQLQLYLSYYISYHNNVYFNVRLQGDKTTSVPITRYWSTWVSSVRYWNSQLPLFRGIWPHIWLPNDIKTLSLTRFRTPQQGNL